MPPLKSFYRGLTKQKRSTTRCVPSSNSGDLCFFLFRFSCGVSSTTTKNYERSISQNRLIGHAPLKSLLVIVDTGFYATKRFLDGVGAFIQLRWSLLFSFSFYFWNFFYENKLKRNERSIFQNRLICQDMVWSLYRGFTKQKDSAPAPVISAFSFFAFLLEFSLREQKEAKVQFLTTALYVSIKKFLPGFYKTNRFCDRAIRCVPSPKSGDLCFFLLPFSFRVSSTRTRSNIKRSISKTTLHAAIIKSLLAFVQIFNKLIFDNREQARRKVNKRCNKIRLKCIV